MRIKNPLISFFVLLAACLAIAEFGRGDDSWVNKSSNCLTTTSLAIIPNVFPGDTLGGLYINRRAPTLETIKIYDSSGTANNLIATIELSTGSLLNTQETGNQYLYKLRLSSGITMTKSAAGSDITITWDSKRNQ